jgi:hypothetical protein
VLVPASNTRSVASSSGAPSPTPSQGHSAAAGAAGATVAAGTAGAVVAPVYEQSKSVNLLDWDDAPAPAPAPAPASSSSSSSSVLFVDCLGRFTPALFQQLWGQLGDAYSGPVCRLQPNPQTHAQPSAADMDAALKRVKVGCGWVRSSLRTW